MSDASTSESISPGLSKVVERAKAEPEGRFHSQAHLIDVPALVRAYGRMRKDAAVGVDGVTKEQYGQDLERNLQDLHERLRSKRYRHQPIRRVHIPKDKGRMSSSSYLYLGGLWSRGGCQYHRACCGNLNIELPRRDSDVRPASASWSTVPGAKPTGPPTSTVIT
jgi:hypothetical protein